MANSWSIVLLVWAAALLVIVFGTKRRFKPVASLAWIGGLLFILWAQHQEKMYGGENAGPVIGVLAVGTAGLVSVLWAWAKINPMHKWDVARTEWRITITLALIWIAGSSIFMFAFGNHAYYSVEDEYWKIAKVALVPSLFGIFSFWLIENAKRKR